MKVSIVNLEWHCFNLGALSITGSLVFPDSLCDVGGPGWSGSIGGSVGSEGKTNPAPQSINLVYW